MGLNEGTEMTILYRSMSSPSSCEQVYSLSKTMESTPTDEGFQEEPNQSDDDASTAIVDLRKVGDQYDLFQNSFKGKVQPFYAVKCNPDPEIIKTLALKGASFDCASKSEIEAVLNVGETIATEMEGEKIIPQRIGFFHPCKFRSSIQYALDNGIRKMTFDSLNELDKIATEYCGTTTGGKRRASPQLLLRLSVNDASSHCPLS